MFTYLTENRSYGIQPRISRITNERCLYVTTLHDVVNDPAYATGLFLCQSPWVTYAYRAKRSSRDVKQHYLEVCQSHELDDDRRFIASANLCRAFLVLPRSNLVDARPSSSMNLSTIGKNPNLIALAPRSLM